MRASSSEARTLASPACVDQIPLTSPLAYARAGVAPTTTSAATTRRQATNRKDQNLVMNREAAAWDAMDGETSEFSSEAPDMMGNKQICAMLDQLRVTRVGRRGR